MLSKNTDEDEEIGTFDIPKEISGLFHKHYDDIIADDTLTNLDVLLLSIHLIEYNIGISGAEYNKCKNVFKSLGRKEDDFRKYVFDAKKKSFILEKNGKLKFMSKGLKKLNQITGQFGKRPVYIFKSGENFSAIKFFEDFLINQCECEEILLCDSHVSTQTLFPFIVLKDKIKSLKILTANIYNKEKFDDYIEKMKKESAIEVRVKINKKIHDRFIIFKENCWTIGSSIKDLGNKDTIIKEINEVMKSMKDLFFQRWNEI